MPDAGQTVTSETHAHSEIASLSTFSHRWSLALRVQLAIQQGGSHRAETDSAANQFGAPESAENLRGTFSVVCGRWLPTRIVCRILQQEGDYEDG